MMAAARKTPSPPANGTARPGLISQALFESVFGGEKDKKKSIRIKLKRPNPKQSIPGNWSNENEVAGLPKKPSNANNTGSPVLNTMPDSLLAGFPTGRLFEDQPDKIMCKHCKRPVLRHVAAEHVKECLDKKQAKLKKKKEKKEAKDAAKKAERAGDEGDDDVMPKSAKKSAIKDDDEGGKKGKKRKLDADAEKAPNAKKKKKDEPKAKPAKTKGPVDVERQCGVQLPNGGQCARSLTCKSHSMGLKRAVPGRSLPYDMLLAQYQKKNQAKQQRAAIDANAPLLDDLDAHGPVDSDEEKDAIMNAIARSRPRPLVTKTFISTRNKYQYVRMKELLHNALGSRLGPNGGAPGSLLGNGPPGLSLNVGVGPLSGMLGTGGAGGNNNISAAPLSAVGDGFGSAFNTPLNSASLDGMNPPFERRQSAVPPAQRPIPQGSMQAPARKHSISSQA